MNETNHKKTFSRSDAVDSTSKASPPSAPAVCCCCCLRATRVSWCVSVNCCNSSLARHTQVHNDPSHIHTSTTKKGNQMNTMMMMMMLMMRRKKPLLGGRAFVLQKTLGFESVVDFFLHPLQLYRCHLLICCTTRAKGLFNEFGCQ